jgi:serine protease Do
VKSTLTVILVLILAGSVSAQTFNFDRINKRATDYTVSVNLEIEVSFGIQTTEAKSRGIGTIVTEDGLVVFDGSVIDNEDPFSQMAGMQITADPKNIEIIFMDGTSYQAEYIGTDRYTRLGFCRIIDEKKTKFPYLKFSERSRFKIGEWFMAYMLLPEYVMPPLSSDIGMVSALIEEPERFVLTVGFNELEIASVLYDSTGSAVGLLGKLTNPAVIGMSAAQMMESFSQVEDYLPLLGVIDASKLKKLIENPPTKGDIDKGWLGVYLQALNKDIAEYWSISTSGGIIISEVVKDSPADTVGLKTGDIIIRLNNEDISVDREENLSIFQRQITDLGAGASPDFTILRRKNGSIDTLEISVLLGRAPLSPSEAPEFEDEHFEMKVRDMVFFDYNIFNLDRANFKGVVVKEIEQGGWSAVGGLMPGDIIQSIDGSTIESVDDAEKALVKLAEEKPGEVIFFVWRDNKTFFINIKTDWK